MSETPRTDANEQSQGMGSLPEMVVSADFARTLERELAAVTRERDALRAEVESLHKAESDFHMAYRMKCDVETKAQAVEIERLRAEVDKLKKQSEVLQAALLKAVEIIGTCDPKGAQEWLAALTPAEEPKT